MTSFVQAHRRDVEIAIGIFAIALVLRLLFIAWINPDPLTVKDDSWFYRNSAGLMAEGEGYVYPAGRYTEEGEPAPTADHPPGYTALLAGAFLVPGPDLIAGKVMNALIGAAGCSVLFVIGRFILDRTVGVAAALLLMFFPSHVIYTTLPITEVTYSTLLSALFLFFLWWLKRADSVTWRYPVLLGLGLGITTMVRGEPVFVFLIFAAVWWLTTQSLRRTVELTAFTVLGLGIIMGGWTIRNQMQLGSPVPISTGNTVLLALGHWKNADGGGHLLYSLGVSRYYEGTPYPEREIKASRKQARDAIDYAFHHPWQELTLIPRRFFYLYENDHTAVEWVAHYELSVGDATLDRLSTVSNVYYFSVAGLALIGTCLWWRANRAATVLLTGTVLYVTALMCIVYFGEPRYHAGLMPFWCLLGGATLAQARQRLRVPSVVPS